MQIFISSISAIYFFLDKERFGNVLHRPGMDEETVFEGPLQVKIHIVFTIEHAMDITARYLFPEDP